MIFLQVALETALTPRTNGGREGLVGGVRLLQWLPSLSLAGERRKISARAGAEGQVGKKWTRAALPKYECIQEITKGSVKMWVVIPQLWMSPELLHF